MKQFKSIAMDMLIRLILRMCTQKGVVAGNLDRKFETPYSQYIQSQYNKKMK